MLVFIVIMMSAALVGRFRSKRAVRSLFSKSLKEVRLPYTGFEIARMKLLSACVDAPIKINAQAPSYSFSEKSVYLPSEDAYFAHAFSAAAACHEASHAEQDKNRYFWMFVRRRLRYPALFLSKIILPSLFVYAFFTVEDARDDVVAALLYATFVFYRFLAVVISEYDANKRSLEFFEKTKLVCGKPLSLVRKIYRVQLTHYVWECFIFFF